MLKRSKSVWLAAALGIAGSGAVASPAFAQATIQTVVRDFQLVGTACPAKSSTMITVTNATATTPALLTIQFPSGDAAVAEGGFRVSGATAQGDCAIQMDVSVSGVPKVEFFVARALANVRFENPDNQGRLSLSSRVRVGDRLSPPRVATVTAPAMGTGAQMSQLSLDPISIGAEIMGQGVVTTTLQLQTLDASSTASFALESIAFTVSITEDIAG